MINIDSIRMPFAGMFAWCKDSMIPSYFEGHIGSGFAERKEAPRWAVVRAGDFLFCAGEPCGIAELAGYIKSNTGAGVIVVAENTDIWQDALELQGLKPDRVARYYMKLPEGGLDAEALRRVTGTADGCLRLVRAGEAEYPLLRDCEWEDAFVVNFRSSEDFLENGFAFCLYAGDELASAASTFGYYSGGYELQIATAPKFRRRGYAQVVGAAFLLECMSQGKCPHWDAAHMGSVRLAQRLGFLLDNEYPALLIKT